MMKRTRQGLVACAFAACAVLSFAFSGCSRDEAAPPAEPAAAPSAAAEAAPPAEPVKVVSRLADPAYKTALDGQMAEMSSLLKTRDGVAAKMRGMVNAARARLATDDEAAVTAELAKDPEWVGLRARFADLNKALEDNRRRSAEVVRRKITAETKEVNLK